MERVLVNGKEYAAGLTWEVVGNGVKDKGAIKTLTDSVGLDAGVRIPARNSSDLQIGLADNVLKGVRSLGGMVADASNGISTLVVSSLQKSDGSDAWWVCLVIDGFVVPGSDIVYDSAASAVRAAKSHSQLGRNIERTIVAGGVSAEFPGAEVFALLDFTGGGAKSHDIHLVGDGGLKTLVIGGIAAAIILVVGGYFIYQNYGEALGLKKPEFVEKSPAQIRQELTAKADRLMRERLIEAPTFSHQLQSHLVALHRMPLFLAGWEIKHISLSLLGEARIDIERREGSIYSLTTISEQQGWQIAIDESGDKAVWTVTFPGAEPAGGIGELPDGAVARNDLKDLFQRINYKGFTMDLAAPLIRKAEIPPNVQFTSPAQVSPFSLRGEGVAYLYGFTEALSSYETMRLTGMDLAVEHGEYSKWTLKGELYEK